jgi:hypothetical protein
MSLFDALFDAAALNSYLTVPGIDQTQRQARLARLYTEIGRFGAAAKNACWRAATQAGILHSDPVRAVLHGHGRKSGLMMGLVTHCMTHSFVVQECGWRSSVAAAVAAAEERVLAVARRDAAAWYS